MLWYDAVDTSTDGYYAVYGIEAVVDTSTGDYYAVYDRDKVQNM